MAKAESLRFTRIKLTNWRNFRSAEIKLAARAFLIGPNASGKSNLLDAFRFLRDLAKSENGGLATALAARGGLSAVRCLEARRPSYVEIDVDVGTDDLPEKWSYRIRFTRKTGEKIVTIIEEEIRGADGTNEIFKRDEGDADALMYSQSIIQQALRIKPFRELVDFFASVRYLHVVPQIVREPQRGLKEGEDPYGGDLLRRMKEMPKKTREPRLKRISMALKIAVPQFHELRLIDDAITGAPHLYASYEHWRPNASKQSEEVFSDGTLRLIGFLWSITEKGGPLLLEEPELSLHDDVAAQIPAMIARSQRLSKRQVIATTHSFSMLNGKGIGLDEVHLISVGKNGSKIETGINSSEAQVLVEEGWTVGEAMLPHAKPRSIEQLALFDVSN